MTPDEIRHRAVNNLGYTGHLWPIGDVRQELIDCPIGPHMLADNEVDDYLALERVIHRHQFYDHDCQGLAGCLGMMILNSPEFTEILVRAQAAVVALTGATADLSAVPDCDGRCDDGRDICTLWHGPRPANESSAETIKQPSGKGDSSMGGSDA